MSIRLRLLLSFALCLAIACGGICAVSFYFVLNLDDERFNALAIGQLEREIERINTMLEPGIMSVRYLADSEVVRASRGRLSSYVDTLEETEIQYGNL
ncbi:MAG: hypothetical protein Q4F27_04000, partial [Desulfovibrionaceae bacterium]|nr:hypothetical protein [Desulfovibrionaceae bacterium]